MVLLNVPDELIVTLTICVIFIMMCLMFDYRREMIHYKKKYHQEWNENVKLSSENQILQSNLKRREDDIL